MMSGIQSAVALRNGFNGQFVSVPPMVPETVKHSKVVGEAELASIEQDASGCVVLFSACSRYLTLNADGHLGTCGKQSDAARFDFQDGENPALAYVDQRRNVLLAWLRIEPIPSAEPAQAEPVPSDRKRQKKQKTEPQLPEVE